MLSDPLQPDPPPSPDARTAPRNRPAPHESPPEERILAIVSDLLAGSRISGTAAALGIGVRVLRPPFDGGIESAIEKAPLPALRAALIDMTLPDDVPLVAIRRLAALLPGLTIVAYCPHVLTERMEAARTAGATRVLPRSAFSKRLPELLAELSGG